MDALTNADNDPEPPLELQPKFTVQDEQRELATLTIQELTKLQSDLTGIQTVTNGISGLGLGVAAGAAASTTSTMSRPGVGSSEMTDDTGDSNVYGVESTASPGAFPPAPLSDNDYLLLAALDQQMKILPAQATAAYFMATAKCPDQVSNERKLLFLQCEENNVPLAAERLALYWQYRLDGFGEDKCFDPMTLLGAMRGEVVNMGKSGVVQLMPNTDAAGRAIIYAIIGKRDYSQYSVKQEVMWITYLLEIVVQHKSLQGRGFVLLMDTSNGTGRHRTRQSQKYMQRAMNGAFPIRLCSIHIVCNANPLFTRVIFPVALKLTSKNMRLRTRLHRGSGEDLSRSLAEFSLPGDRLPSDMGGSVVLDINQFLIDRISVEASRAGICLKSAEVQSSPDNSGMEGKRQKVSENDTKAIVPTGACADGNHQLTLYSESDKAYLSPLACLIRSQIEIFTATKADVQTRAAMGGIVQTISTGRVGVRCIHCRDRPATEQAKGAVS